MGDRDRVLVTGGAGFIGSNLVDRLCDGGHEVIAVDDLTTGRRANLARSIASERLVFLRADVRNARSIAAIVRAYRPEVVVHLAAQINVRRSVEDPLEDATINVLGTIGVLEAARLTGVRKVVLATSGGCIYGEPDESELPVREDHPGHAHSPYGASKRCAEEYLHTYAALYGLAWTSLALSNVYGPRQDPAGEAGVVAIFIERMLAGAPVTIYGDGTQTRDFVHVSDVVEAFVAALDRGDGERLNVGTGRRTSVTEVYDVLAAATGYPDPPVTAAPRPGELLHSSVDPGRAAVVLGWRPRVELEDGLRGTVSWTRSRLGLDVPGAPALVPR